MFSPRTHPFVISIHSMSIGIWSGNWRLTVNERIRAISTTNFISIVFFHSPVSFTLSDSFHQNFAIIAVSWCHCCNAIVRNWTLCSLNIDRYVCQSQYVRWYYYDFILYFYRCVTFFSLVRFAEIPASGTLGVCVCGECTCIEWFRDSITNWLN